MSPTSRRPPWARRSWCRRQARSVLSPPSRADRKSTRLNSSHANISYAVFCLKKKDLTLAVDNGAPWLLHPIAHGAFAELRANRHSLRDGSDLHALVTGSYVGTAPPPHRRPGQ